MAVGVLITGGGDDVSKSPSQMRRSEPLPASQPLAPTVKLRQFFQPARDFLGVSAAVKGRNTKVAFSLRAKCGTRCDEWKVTIVKTFARDFLNGETFAARAVSDSVGIRDFEAAFLQIFAVIEHGAANE